MIPIKHHVLRGLALALTAWASSPAPAPAAPAPLKTACCRVSAGTRVVVELAEEVTSAASKRGDTFAIRLAAPLIVNGRVVLPAGTPGLGEVIDDSHRSIGGKPAKMVLAADYLETNGRRVALNALKLAGHGHDNSTTAGLLEIGGLASLPLGIAGIVLPGGGVVFKAGSVAEARLASDVVLPPIARATARDRAEVASAATRAGGDIDVAADLPIPPPPPGMGQVVFFRAKSLLGTAQWFNVRENGVALGRLDNGAYFIQPETPGVHTFTAKLEPELKDRLKLQIDAGQTYFVEGDLTAGLVITAADLEPSTIEKFNKAARHLKLAKTPTSDTTALADQGADPGAGAPAPGPTPDPARTEPAPQ